MNLTQSQIKFITDNKNMIFATSANNRPRAIIVLPSDISENRIILSNMQMNISATNKEIICIDIDSVTDAAKE